MPLNKVIIVGAGPTGLILGLLLAKQGIHVDILDPGATLDKQPRAAHYASPAAYELDRAGVLDDVTARGINHKKMIWRKVDTDIVAIMRLDRMPEERKRHSLVVLPLGQLGEILYEHLQRQPTVSVRWSHRVVKVGQDGDKAWVDVETGDSKKRFEADYALGCDGASSTVQRELFGSEYPGETLDAQLVATNVYYNFDCYNYTDTNFIIHPKNFYMAACITVDGLYRVTYGDTPGLTREEFIARQPMRYKEILPGNPKPGDYQITNISPYRMQRRCAPSFRMGRVVLAADAAHVCNPFGGLGLTGGIADAGSLFDALMGIHMGLSDDSILDKYSEVRRKIWSDVIDPASRENLRRPHEQEASTARENDEFFKLCVRAEADEGLAGELPMGLEVLRHDMTPILQQETGHCQC
ncbi:FAD-dependent oxidoreductase [Aspergillus ruber CBS 135680]|uniref:FAD/NAD(P)-binding domain-containing protein n=1 Tax=Aspergillus ruber (strain CBS 135680) TaxID=1388766 RepID=A0A017SCC3_ASPRC|nr:FAD/NAD(P)-binding domain-containing protein [Aspergillus ruber CBS 135680]EYE94441.1 FAD/NAD(P)-binding domain-containing protein [Aspergillus ruber CBS 135680]